MEPQDHKSNKWTWTSRTEKNKLKQNLKTAFRMKVSELCKNRSKKSSPDMFNLYVVLTSHDTVTAVGRASIFRPNFNSPSLQRKVQ